MSLQKLQSYFSSPLFLVMAILMSVAAVLTFNILTIILTIGMWIAFASAKKEKLAESFTGLKMISGTVKAHYIITWVAIVICIVTAVLAFVFSSFIASTLGDETLGSLIGDRLDDIDLDTVMIPENLLGDSELDIDAILSSAGVTGKADISSLLGSIDAAELEDSLGDILSSAGVTGKADISSLLGALGAGELKGGLGGILSSSEKSLGFLKAVLEAFSDVPVGKVMSAVFTMLGVAMLILAVIVMIPNIFYTKRIHLFTKSLCVSFESGAPALAPVKYMKAVKNWSMVLGVLNALSAIGSLSDTKSFICTACVAVTHILGFVFVKQIINDSTSAELGERAE